MAHSAQSSGQDKHATIFRIVSPEHVCPFGEAAIELLQREGYDIDDHWLRTRAETAAYMASEGVLTTPQIFIDGNRIGGYDELAERESPIGR